MSKFAYVFKTQCWFDAQLDHFSIDEGELYIELTSPNMTHAIHVREDNRLTDPETIAHALIGLTGRSVITFDDFVKACCK